jgi:hypothetical protein
MRNEEKLKERFSRPGHLRIHESDVTTAVAVHPDLGRVPLTTIGHPEEKERSGDEECTSPESPLEVLSGQCNPG